MYRKLCTEFYDADKLFANDEELALYKQLFSKSDLLLEPMCGSGRLLIPLMQLGYKIHGLDNSASMLESCKQRATALHLKPILYQESVSEFSTKQHYDGIIISLGSFQLLYPRQIAYSALAKFHELLSVNGKLVMDLFVPWEAMYEHGEEDTSFRKIQLPSGEWIEIKSHTIANKFEQHLLNRNHYKKYVNDKVIAEEEEEEMNILWYYRNEMELLLEKHGFKDIKVIERFLNGSSHMTFIAAVSK